MKALTHKMIFVSLLAVTLLANACKKDKTSNPSTLSKTQYLTSGSWKMVTFKYKYNNDAWQDWTSLFSPCELDNRTTFYTNFTTLYDEGTTKCDPNDPQTTPGTWGYSDNESKIILDGTDTNTIITLNSTTLRLQSLSVSGGDTEIYEMTFIH